MTITMTEPETTSEAGETRVRVIFDTEELIRQAINLRAMKDSVAARRSVSKSETLTEILREVLADEIAELTQPRKPRGKR